MRNSVFALFVLLSLTAFSQEDSKEKQFLNKLDAGEQKTATTSVASTSKEGDNLFGDTDSIRIKVKSFPDVSNYYYECYASVVNKYGFWQGVGPKLTPEDIRHRWRYVKLMRPAGLPLTAPFTHMQVLNPWGKLANNSYGPILANPFGSDNGISSDWTWKLKNICQFELIYRNGVVVQENMYDDDGELVLQYFPTSVSKNQIIGHYTDAYGALAHLRKDESCTHIGVTLDDNGYECQITFMDEKGQLKRNGDDAFFQLWTRDAHGNTIQTMSADALGNPIIDNCGNCGWQYVYDSNGRMMESTCIDQYGQPQRMSKKKDADTEDMIRARYTYDRWGNMESKTFYDADWNPDTITGGIHRYIYTHTLYGNTSSMRAEGLDGRLAGPSGQNAMWQRELNENGNTLYLVELESDSLLTRSGECITRARYEGETKVWEVKYTSPNGVDSVLTYRYVRTPLCDSIFHYDDEYINLEHYDNRRRMISDEYYNLDMTPIRRLYYHKHTTTYREQPGFTTREERYFDIDGQPMPIEDSGWRSYNADIYTHDLIHRTYSDCEYDGQQLIRSIEVDSVARRRVTTNYEDGLISSKYGQLLSEDCSQVESLINFDSLGALGRTFKTDAHYYQVRKSINVQGNNTSWSGINEFGEPSYVMTGDWDNAVIYCVNVLGDPYYYDEHGDTIPNTAEGRKEFKSKLYKAFCIELTDSLAYQYGLRTGDLIVRYGDWQYPIPTTSGGYRRNLLSFEIIRKAMTEKTVVVMRHDPATHTSRLLQLQLPVGTQEQIGFLFHMIYLTEREHERYTATVKEQRSSVDLSLTNNIEEENDKTYLILPCKVGSDKAKRAFIGGFKFDAVVLGWEIFENGKSYFFKTNDDYIDSDFAFAHPYDSVVLHYTIDAHTAQRYTFRDDDFRYRVIRSRTPIADASDFRALADSLQQDFDRRHPETPVVLQPRAAAQRLQALQGVKESESEGEGFRGQGQYKYGDVRQFYNVKFSYDDLSYSDMFLARNILENIDFSPYIFGYNNDDSNFLLFHKGRFTELCWRTTTGINFVSGDVMMEDMQTLTFNVEADGLMRQRGLDGKFVVLQCNDWKYGMTNRQLSTALQGDANGIRKIKLAQVMGEGADMHLGPTRTIKFPEGILGELRSYESLPESIFMEALRRSGR